MFHPFLEKGKRKSSGREREPDWSHMAACGCALGLISLKSQICSLVARHWFATQSRFFRYYMQTLSQNLPKGVAGKVCVSTHRVWPFFMKNPQPGKGTWPYWEQWQRLDFSLTYGFCKCWLPKCVFSAGWCVGCSLINHFYYPLVCIKLKKINLEQGSHSFSLI